MAITESDLVALLQRALPEAEIDVRALRDDGEHYSIRVISPQFRGHSRIAQHKMIYEALGGRAGKDIHALAIHTLTPEKALKETGESS